MDTSVCETTFEIVADDGQRLFARQWKPSGSLAGNVGIIHGLGEHSGRYGEAADSLAKAGYCVTSFDHRGHGRTAGKRGHVHSYDRMLQDIVCLLAELSSRRPCFLYGQSLGGNLVLNCALRRKPSLAGLVVSSPLLQPTSAPPMWKRTVARALNVVYPEFSFNSRLKAEDLSHDPDVVRCYQADPLVHNRVSARLAIEMFRAGRYALEKAEKLTFPLLLLHGEKDRITSPQATRMFAARAGPLCDLRISERGFHELHWEDDRADTVAHIITWLNEQQT